jgi:hypothetical protein
MAREARGNISRSGGQQAGLPCPSLARPADDGEQAEVCLSSHRIGTLSAAGSAGFWSFLDKARSQGRRVHVMALSDQDASGAWALRIYLPHPQPGQDRARAPGRGMTT